MMGNNGSRSRSSGSSSSRSGNGGGVPNNQRGSRLNSLFSRLLRRQAAAAAAAAAPRREGMEPLVDDADFMRHMTSAFAPSGLMTSPTRFPRSLVDLDTAAGRNTSSSATSSSESSPMLRELPFSLPLPTEESGATASESSPSSLMLGPGMNLIEQVANATGSGRLQPGVHLFYTGGMEPRSGTLVVLFVGGANGDGPRPPNGTNVVMYVITGGDGALGGNSYEELLALQERLGLVSRGASVDSVRTLPMTVFQKGVTVTEEVNCCICLRDYEDGDGIRRLPCQHGFHSECVDKWLVESVNSCPLCRTEAVPRAQPSVA